MNFTAVQTSSEADPHCLSYYDFCLRPARRGRRGPRRHRRGDPPTHLFTSTSKKKQAEAANLTSLLSVSAPFGANSRHGSRVALDARSCARWRCTDPDLCIRWRGHFARGVRAVSPFHWAGGAAPCTRPHSASASPAAASGGAALPPAAAAPAGARREPIPAAHCAGRAAQALASALCGAAGAHFLAAGGRGAAHSQPRQGALGGAGARLSLPGQRCRPSRGWGGRERRGLRQPRVAPPLQAAAPCPRSHSPPQLPLCCRCSCTSQLCCTFSSSSCCCCGCCRGPGSVNVSAAAASASYPVQPTFAPAARCAQRQQLRGG